MSVWKKTDADEPQPKSHQQSQSAPPSQPRRGAEAQRSRNVATIGPSIAIRGDVTGEEDLLIEGRIEGKVLLQKNHVTVGKNGRVKADVFARSVAVEGEVEGDLMGQEEVTVRPSGKVRGNIQAPSVTLDSGCRFQGSIDMEKGRQQQGKEARPAEVKPKVQAPSQEQTTLKPAAGTSP